jgi:rod shape-determining protein MreD
VRNAAFLLAGFVLILVQSNLFRLTTALHRFLAHFSTIYADAHGLHATNWTPQLVLPLIVFMGVHEYSLARGAGIVFALGYLTDLVGIAPVGLYTFTYVALFLLARAAGVRLAAQTTLMQLLLALGFALLHSVTILVLLTIFGRDPWVPRALYRLVIPHVIATAAVAPLVFRLAQRVHVATARSAEVGGRA